MFTAGDESDRGLVVLDGGVGFIAVEVVFGDLDRFAFDHFEDAPDPTLLFFFGLLLFFLFCYCLYFVEIKKRVNE